LPISLIFQGWGVGCRAVKMRGAILSFMSSWHDA
jgi:hypothetical protein